MNWLATLPDDSGRVVSMAVVGRDLVVACENGVYVVDRGDGTVVKVVAVTGIRS